MNYEHLYRRYPDALKDLRIAQDKLEEYECRIYSPRTPSYSPVPGGGNKEALDLMAELIERHDALGADVLRAQVRAERALGELFAVRDLLPVSVRGTFTRRFIEFVPWCQINAGARRKCREAILELPDLAE